MVLPSFAEGLPVVIMEALALHRPVISTYIAGIPELVSNDCGWLITPGSAEALVTAMASALQTPTDKLEHMGQIGSDRVTREHNIDTEAAKLAALFQTSTD
jgi:colanic acid/amylovoran biosynthesis glycosyltransferase